MKVQHRQKLIVPSFIKNERKRQKIYLYFREINARIQNKISENVLILG